jgi:hypothetical protein
MWGWLVMCGIAMRPRAKQQRQLAVYCRSRESKMEIPG